MNEWMCHRAEFSPWLSGWRSASRVRSEIASTKLCHFLYFCFSQLLCWLLWYLAANFVECLSLFQDKSIIDIISDPDGM